MEVVGMFSKQVEVQGELIVEGLSTQAAAPLLGLYWELGSVEGVEHVPFGAQWAAQRDVHFEPAVDGPPFLQWGYIESVKLC